MKRIPVEMSATTLAANKIVCGKGCEEPHVIRSFWNGNSETRQVLRAYECKGTMYVCAFPPRMVAEL